uniref:Uncharacterized protein n=1 Tax=Magallana gigas TaxID=29159 RepID=A0A8W8LKD1_MAGGI
MSEADVENGDHVGLLAQKPNPGLKFDKKLSETERSTREIRTVAFANQRKEIKFNLNPGRNKLHTRSISQSSTDSYSSRVFHCVTESRLGVSEGYNQQQRRRLTYSLKKKSLLTFSGY